MDAALCNGESVYTYLVIRIVGVLPVMDCGPKVSVTSVRGRYVCDPEVYQVIDPDSRGRQHEELVYIWLHLLHCR